MSRSEDQRANADDLARIVCSSRSTQKASLICTGTHPWSDMDSNRMLKGYPSSVDQRPGRGCLDRPDQGAQPAAYPPPAPTIPTGTHQQVWLVLGEIALDAPL